MDVARLGLAIDSSQVEKGTVSLHQLTGAAGQASVAAQKLAGASQVEATGQKAATVAVQAHNAALVAQNTVMRSSMQQRTMMIYQLNDVAVSLASGMNPAMVAMQQGSQILQGGLMPAIRTLVDLGKSLVVTFWPVAAVIGAVAAAVAGLTYEINKTADVQVGFFDVALAGWQLLAEQITSWVAPVFGAIGSWLQQGWDAAAPILKDIGNALVGTFVFAFEAIKISWGSLPTAIGDLAYQAADRVVFGVQYMIRTIQMKINEFLQGTDAALQGAGLPGTGLRVGVMWPEHMENPFAGAADAFGSDLGAASSAFDVDYMGNAFGALSKRAQEIAAAKGELDELGGSAKAANDNVKELAEDGMGKLGQFGKSVLSTLSSGFSDLFKALMNGTKSATDAIADLLGKLGDLFIDQAFNMLIGGMFGGGFGMGGGGGGLFGGSIIPGILHSGGVAGSDGYGHGRAFGANTWANAPRYHNGGVAGLRPNEVPAILERGERVIPANQNGGGQTVVVIRLEDGLRADIVGEATGQAVQITKGMVEPVSRTVNQMAQQQRYG